jgi:nitroreductase
MADSEWSTGPDGAPGPAMSACLLAAIAAPSIHNTQPWLFRPHTTTVDVLVDPRRRLEVADPDGREMHVSVGAAVLNLRLAMLARGRQPLVRLLPDPDQADLAATLTVGPAVHVDDQTRTLAEAIPQRHTNRRPFGSTPVPEPVLAALVAAARAEGASLVFADPATRNDVLDIVRSAEHKQRADARYRAELAAWTATSPERPDGVPAEAFGPRPELAALPVRDFDPERVHPRRVARFERDATVAVLYTAEDGRADWLRAGQALERVLLTATARGLATAPLTQAMEVAELRRLLGTPPDARVAQSILRLGYAARSRPTPRRPLTDVLLRANE